MKNLSNNFLISMPHVNDPIFKKSLVYICSHDKDGAMGLIINKSISYKQCKLLFNLFENIMKNHLINNSSKKIPKVYYDFKQTILLNINK